MLLKEDTAQDALFRNPLSEVVKLFTQKHSNSYKIYNLCSEKQYSPSVFESKGGQCAEYPFDDHNAPPFDMLIKFCQDAKVDSVVGQFFVCVFQR